MKVTNIQVHSATVTAQIELTSGEVAQLGMTIDEHSLAQLAQAKLAPANYIEHDEHQPPQLSAFDHALAVGDAKADWEIAQAKDRKWEAANDKKDGGTPI